MTPATRKPGTAPRRASWNSGTTTLTGSPAGTGASAATFTYNSPDAHLGGVTYGGYSERMVFDEHFVRRIPSNLDPAGAALRLTEDNERLIGAVLLAKKRL